MMPDILDLIDETLAQNRETCLDRFWSGYENQQADFKYSYIIDCLYCSEPLIECKAVRTSTSFACHLCVCNRCGHFTDDRVYCKKCVDEINNRSGEFVSNPVYYLTC